LMHLPIYLSTYPTYPIYLPIYLHIYLSTYHTYQQIYLPNYITNIPILNIYKHI
jgi:hypothetical protein